MGIFSSLERRCKLNTAEPSVPSSNTEASTDACRQLEPPQEFSCPVSMEVMVSPVMVLQTGQIYDNSSFTSWLLQGGTTCSMTGLKLVNPIILRPRLALRAEIEAWAAEHGITLPPAEYGHPARSKVSNPLKRYRLMLKDFAKFLLSDWSYYA